MLYQTYRVLKKCLCFSTISDLVNVITIIYKYVTIHELNEVIFNFASRQMMMNLNNFYASIKSWVFK